MENKNILKDEELQTVTGGSEFDYHGNLVLCVCDCGYEITLECDISEDSQGNMVLKCPNCHKLHTFK